MSASPGHRTQARRMHFVAHRWRALEIVCQIGMEFLMRMPIAAIAIAALAAIVSAPSASPTAQTGVAACQAEAVAGHARAWQLEPSLRSMIEEHRTRMSAACARVATERQAALADCLAEAARGPRHIQRGRNMDRDHIARQKELCRKLAAG